MRQICARLSHREERKSRLTVEEGRPAAPAVKFGAALVKRRAAPCAGVDALPLEVLVLAGAGRLGALFSQDAELRKLDVSACFPRHPSLVRTCSGDRMALHSLSLLFTDSPIATRVTLK